LTKEKNEALSKISELEALNLEKYNRLAALEAKIKQVKEVYNAGSDKIWRVSRCSR
jgi:hypothetical protein